MAGPIMPTKTGVRGFIPFFFLCRNTNCSGKEYALPNDEAENERLGMPNARLEKNHTNHLDRPPTQSFPSYSGRQARFSSSE